MSDQSKIVVNMRKNDAGKLFCTLNENHEGSRPYYPHRRWLDAREGKAEVYITNEVRTHGYVKGRML